MAALRALAHRERTGHWPKVLIEGKDPFGREYVGRFEGKGFRVICLGEDGIEQPAPPPVTFDRTSGSRTADLVVAYPFPGIPYRMPGRK